MSDELNTCPTCGLEAEPDELSAHECEPEKLSVDLDTMDADLDRMVQTASLPNLGALFQSAQDKGLIKPQVVGSGQPA